MPPGAYTFKVRLAHDPEAAAAQFTFMIIPPFYRTWWFGLAALAALASVLYLLHLRHVAANPSLIDFWRRSFAPLPPWSHWGWYRASLSGVLNHLFSFHAGAVPSLLLLVGTASLWVRRRPLALAMVLTLVATLVASALSRYPFHGRFLLFMMPAAALAPAGDTAARSGIELCLEHLNRTETNVFNAGRR